jgi:pyruvate kinase
MIRRAKIVATVGPASSSEAVIARLLRAGVDVVRLNLSHGDHAFHRGIIHTVRAQATRQGRFVPVIVDLMGPRYRLAKIADGPRALVSGQQLTLGYDTSDVDLPVEDTSIIDHLQIGERVLIDNGLLELKVLTKGSDRVTAQVVHGGLVSTRKGINLPDTELPFTITEKDRADIQFAIQEDADYIAVSFVGGPDDLEAIRAVMAEYKGRIPLIAKLERATVMRRLEKTIQVADAVMVARGDLGVELPLHKVPTSQKKIVGIGRHFGKPVIVATQMLESMMSQPRPTRAESSDVANAVLDGADALMLSGETAAGQFPVEVVETMVQIIREAESYRRHQMAPSDDLLDEKPSKLGTHLMPADAELPYLNRSRDIHLEIPESVAAAAVFVVERLDAKQIVAFSQGGFTARMIARYRPNTPLTVFTTNIEVARRVQLVWGTQPLLMDDEANTHDEVVAIVDRMLVDHHLAQPGDTVVILMGDPIRERPLTNLMRVHRVRG